MSAYSRHKPNTETDRTLLMLVLHFMNESEFTGEHWEIIATIISEQEAKQYSTGPCWSRYMSLMFEARRKFLPNSTKETVDPDANPEFEGEFDIEAALAEGQCSDVQRAQHETQLLGNDLGLENARSRTKFTEQAFPVSKANSTSKPAGIVKNRAYKGKSKTTATTREREQRPITSWVARN